MSEALLGSIITGLFLAIVALINRLLPSRQERISADLQRQRDEAAADVQQRKDQLDFERQLRAELRNEGVTLRDNYRIAEQEKKHLETLLDQRDTTVAEQAGRIAALEQETAMWKQRVQAFVGERDLTKLRTPRIERKQEDGS